MLFLGTSQPMVSKKNVLLMSNWQWEQCQRPIFGDKTARCLKGLPVPYGTKWTSRMIRKTPKTHRLYRIGHPQNDKTTLQLGNNLCTGWCWTPSFLRPFAGRHLGSEKWSSRTLMNAHHHRHSSVILYNLMTLSTWHYLTFLLVGGGTTHLKNMLVKLDHFPK